MQKHAILIMAHNQYDILEKLLIMLDHERNDIYIHIDRKSGFFDEEHFKQLCHHSRVTFIPRKRLHWGHSSLVECELDLMEAAVSSGETYCYFHLLSGVDLQIKHTEEIHRFFDEHPDWSLGGHMRLIDRERSEGASPHTFTMEDWEMIEQCPYFWARKFDMSRDSEVIEKVYNTWRSEGEAAGGLAI
ncbi:MAG: beta-1,6-N-acetylglucosaminyltransferase [Dorea sp.]|nr:beta-1,6-N-acetylglucosaminyltransferase [Dorea sp.]